MNDLPTGTVTFLFTDIEGSTRLVQALGERYRGVLARHHQLIREAIAAHGGVEVMTEGDAFFVVFRSPMAALSAVGRAQGALQAEEWPPDGEVRVRMGLHTGEALLGGDNYVGLDVHRAARIAGAANGCQVLVSDATRALVEQALPGGLSLRDLGQHRLPDLPSPERVYQLVADGLADDFPPIRSLNARPNNLPASVTSFVGRERQIEELRTLLSANRLVTLTGPGGTGKTRLSLRVAEEALTDFEDGCWFVELEALRDPELVPSAIAGALGVRLAGDRPARDTLADWLAERELLLVVDNFEQVTTAAPLVGELLARAPRLRVMATSRAPLHLYGEQEYGVPPLASAAELRQMTQPSVDALSQYESVRLFIDRALAVRPDFKVTNANAPALAEICARLDGLPLAIELAAARVKLLTPDQILARLDQSLSILATSAQDLPARQRTLRGAIDWSFDLLSETERRLFARLSAFRGGFTLGAAEQVCGGGDVGGVFDSVASLVDMSLLRTDEQAGEPRFAMLETIREYAAERLAASEEADAVRRRHAEFYFALALSAEPHLTMSDQAEWLDRVSADHDNLRAAFARAHELGLLDAALTAAGALWRFWQQRGHFAEARTIFERLLALSGADPAARGRALGGAGGIAYWQGDFDAVGRWYREARELYEQLGDRARLAEALHNEAYVPLLKGDLQASRELAARSADLYAELGDEMGEAEARLSVGFTYYFEGLADDALASMHSAVAIYRRANARWHLADTLTGLAMTDSLAGNWPAAIGALREALDMFAESSNDVGVAMAAEGVAAIAAWAGEAEMAARLFGAGDAIKERAGGGAPSQFIQTERYRAKAREELGAEDYDRVHAASGRMSSAALADLARTVEPPADTPPMPAPKPWGAAAEGAAGSA